MRPQIAVAHHFGGFESCVGERRPNRERSTAGKSHHSQIIGVHAGQCTREIGGGAAMRQVHSQGRHAEHGRVQIIQIAPIASARLTVEIRLGFFVAVAAIHPVDGERNETIFRHLVAVIVVVQGNVGAQFRRGIVAHNGFFAELAVTVPAQNRRAFFFAS